MKQFSCAVFLAVGGILLADQLPFTFAPEKANDRVVWQSAKEPVPASHPALEVKFSYVCHGPVEINAALEFFTADGRFVEHKFMRPSLKIPAKSEWG